MLTFQQFFDKVSEIRQLAPGKAKRARKENAKRADKGLKIWLNQIHRKPSEFFQIVYHLVYHSLFFPFACYLMIEPKTLFLSTLIMINVRLKMCVL